MVTARRSATILLASFLLLASTAPPRAQGTKLRLDGSIGGVSYAVARSGSIAYVGEGAHLSIFNVSNPAAPALLSRIRLPDFVRAIRVSGTVAYVAASSAGLYAVNIANPALPFVMGFYDTPGTAVNLTVRSLRAFVADSESGLQIIDISNPAAMTLVGSFNSTGRAFGVAVSGTLAFLADDTAGFEVLTVSNPATPALLGSLPLAGRAFDVAVTGTTALVAGGTAGLQVVNFSDPFNPSLVTSIDTPGTAFRIAINGPVLYLADRESGIQLFDISVPASPSLIGSYASRDDAYDVTVVSNVACVAAFRAGFETVNVANPTAPVRLASYEPPTESEAISVAGSTAVVADGSRGLKILNVAAPTLPQLIGSMPTTDAVHDVLLQGSTAYVAAGAEGFKIVNLSNPFAPTVIGTHPSPALGLAVSGTRAFVTLDSTTVGGMNVLDISDPTSPTLVGFTAQGTAGRWVDVEVVGDLAYSAASADGLKIIAVASFATPMILGSYNTTGIGSSVVVRNSLAYFADTSGGLRILDVSDPFTIVQRGAIHTPGLAQGVALSGAFAYVADGTAGLQLINVSSPDFPVLLDTADTPGTARRVETAGSFAYLSDKDGGVGIYSTGITPVPPVISDPGDVIIGDLEPSTASATAANLFVYPDAFDLRAIGRDNNVLPNQIKWSFTGGAGRILINGVGPLDPGLAGINMDDPTAPRISSRIDLNENDIEHVDNTPFTVTFRNTNLSPPGGPNINPGAPGIVPSETTAITLFASDCTTFSSKTIIVYSANDTSDSLSLGGFKPVTSNDFTQQGDVGGTWIGGVVTGGGATSVNASGLCMTVPLLGDNILVWVSPERYIELVDNTVYRVRVTASTDQSARDAIPLWNINYDNFNSSGLGNTFGGSAWILDVDGGAEGIGRLNGRTSFDVFITPNAAQTEQWRGTIDPANSAFSTAADAFNDIRLIFRVLDVGSAGVLSNADTGTICISSVQVDSILIDDLVPAAVVYNTPISNATHFAATVSETGGGSGVIDDTTNTANYSLTTTIARKTLGPFDSLEVNQVLRLYPVVWQGNTLYRGRVRIRSNVDLDGLGAGQGITEGLDPVDSISLLFDTTNSELGQFHYTTRGAPANMEGAAAPRLPANTGGQSQTYIGYFYGQNATSSLQPNANRLRCMADFANSLDLFGISGGDAFSVESLEVDKMILP